MHLILRETEHRPYPLPVGPWIQRQAWCDVLFAHWPVSEASLRLWVPVAFRIGYLRGLTWVGVTPLIMRRLRLRGVAPVPGVSEVLEIDLRTYVRLNGTRVSST